MNKNCDCNSECFDGGGDKNRQFDVISALIVLRMKGRFLNFSFIHSGLLIFQIRRISIYLFIFSHCEKIR